MSQSRPPLKRIDPPPPGWPDWMEQWLMPYLREPALWPVLIALLGHVVVGLSPLMLALWRTGSLNAGLALAVLLVGSLGLVGFEIYRFRSPGPVALTCVLTWLAGGGVAWLADRTGTF